MELTIVEYGDKIIYRLWINEGCYIESADVKTMAHIIVNNYLVEYRGQAGSA